MESRKAIVAGVVGALVALTTGCAGSGSTEPSAELSGGAAAVGGGDGVAVAPSDVECKPTSGRVDLRVQTWVPGFDKVADMWNEANPDIQVKVEFIPGGQSAYQKYAAQLTAGNSPDIGQVEYNALPQFMSQAGLRDISACPGVSEVSKVFPRFTIAQATLGQPGLFAIPQDIGPMGLFYNKAVFDKAGVKVPTTWEEFATAAEAIHKTGPNTYISAFPVEDGGWLQGLYQQAGAKPITYEADGSVKVTYDSDPAVKKVNEFWQGLLDKGLLDTKRQIWGPDFNKALNDGDLATWTVAVWGAGVIEKNAPDASGDWAVAPLPVFAGSQPSSGAWGGSTNVVFPTSEHPAEAAKFITWVNTDPKALDSMIQTGSLYPATTDTSKVTKLKAPVAYFGGLNLEEVFSPIVKTVDPTFAFPPTSKPFAAIADANAAIIAGTKTIQGSMTDVQKVTVDELEAQQIKVAK